MRKSDWLSKAALKLFVLLVVPFASFTQTWGPKYVSMTYGSGGYYEYLPVGYDDPANATKRYPVILFIQGIGDMGNGTTDLWMVRRTGFPTVINGGFFPNEFNVNGETFSFIAIVPQFSSWPEPQQIHNILNFIEANYRADASRLYLTGLSMGGGATWDYAGAALANANRLAAIFPVCGASVPNTTRMQNIAGANLPVLATHNNLDPTVPVSYTIDYVDGINRLNPNPPAIKLIWNAALHNCWTRSYDPAEKLVGNMNAYEWMLQYKRGGPLPPPPPASPLTASISSSSMVSCFSTSTGSATVSAAGGTAPYTYSWSTTPVQTTTTAINLGAGNYTATVRDAAGRTATTTVTITQPAELVFTVTPGTITTNGGTTSVSLSASGGTAPYTFTGPTTNVAAGTYTYTVSDAKGCSLSRTVTITEPAASGPPATALSASISSSSPATCFSTSTGSATATASGGQAPYTYSWSTVPVQTTATASNLGAGNYTVTIRDAAGATATATVTIAQPAELVLNISTGTITTYGGTTSVTLSASGGTAPYSFSGPTTNVKAGTYTYTVTDARGCSLSRDLTITQPAPPAVIVDVTSIRNVGCNGGSDGTATASVSGGTAPFTYSWNTSPVQTGAVANGLRAGSYTVTVRDANGLSSTATVTISEPTALQLTVNPGTISTYNGTTTVSLSASGGTPSYSFSGGPTLNVTAGTYTYQVVDANGCVRESTVTITQPAPPPTASVLWLSGGSTNVSCNGASDGTATVKAETGTAPFTYSWNTVPVQTGKTATGLKAGTYSVTVTDASGVSGNTTITVSQPNVLVIQASGGTITSFGRTTSVVLSATGGTAPYQYTGTTQSLTAGTYNYTVRDANGCTASTSVTLTQPDAILTLAATAGTIRCSGGTTDVTLLATGGSAPYSYAGSTQGLKAGTYTFTVTDAKGVSASATITLSEPQALSLTATPGSIETYGGFTSVSLQAFGGTAPYVYSGTQSGIPAGQYTYSVTDANGCSASTSVSITQPDPILLKATAGKIRCNGGTTDVSLRVEGGIAPYSFLGDTVGLKAGTYYFAVTDAKGNKAVASVDLQEPERLELIATPGLIRKIGGSTDVQLNAKGGSAPYTYAGPAIGVKAGIYQYTVTDANSCQASASTEVREPAVKLASFDLAKGDTAVSLKWTTSYEYAIDHFDIERSPDTVNFSVIGRTSSLWSSLRLANYLLTDGRPAAVRNIYRIVAVTSYGERIILDQKDLIFQARNVVAVRNMTRQLDISVENPHMEEIQVSLYDQNGRLLKTSKFSKQTYLWNIKFDMQSLPTGSYIIGINSAHVKHAKQVIKL